MDSLSCLPGKINDLISRIVIHNTGKEEGMGRVAENQALVARWLEPKP